MTLVKYNTPVSPLSINSFFDEIEQHFNNSILSKYGYDEFHYESEWPKHDVYKNDSEYLLVMDIPTIYNKENITIKVENQKLLIMATKSDQTDKYKDYEKLYQSRKKSSWSKEFDLNPRVVKIANINAKFENGLLEIKIPIRKEIQEANVSKQIKL